MLFDKRISLPTNLCWNCKQCILNKYNFTCKTGQIIIIGGSYIEKFLLIKSVSAENWSYLIKNKRKNCLQRNLPIHNIFNLMNKPIFFQIFYLPKINTRTDLKFIIIIYITYIIQILLWGNFWVNITLPWNNKFMIYIGYWLC